MTHRVDIEMCRVALRGLVDYWFTGERNGARFSIPVQPNDADVLLSKALDEFKALREAAEEAKREIEYWHDDYLTEEERMHPRGSGWARVYDKLVKALGGDVE